MGILFQLKLLIERLTTIRQRLAFAVGPTYRATEKMELIVVAQSGKSHPTTRSMLESSRAVQLGRCSFVLMPTPSVAIIIAI